MIAWLAHLAAAQAVPSDQVVTSIGAQAALAPAIDQGDVDLLLGERVRWRLAELPSGSVTALLDARLTLDPQGTEDPWEQNRLRSAEARILSGPWTFDLGRSAVWRGGPRLVDGLQARVKAGHLEVGAWGGAAPDLFTTRPEARFGGGPMVAFDRRAFSASAVGELLFAAGGLDRAAVLLLGGFSAAPVLELSGRLDLQLADAEGRLGLADGALEARSAPADGLRLHAIYDAFSTIRYLGTEALDPDVERWIERLQASGLSDAFVEDLADPRLYHLVGADGRWTGSGGPALPRFGAEARYRWHPDPELRYTRAGPSAALVTDRAELTADLQLVLTEAQGLREDLGLSLLVEPTSDGALAIDTSARLLLEPAYEGTPGFYADLFVDWLAPAGFVLIAGASTIVEPLPVTDPGFGAFVQVQHQVRHRHPPR